MINRAVYTTCVLLALSRVVWSVPRPSGPQSVHKLAQYYEDSTWPSRLVQPTEGVILATARRERSPALFYYLASQHPNRPQFVEGLVHSAVARGPDDELLLSPALKLLFLNGRSHSALRYLMTLRFDGAPSEYLSTIQYQIAVRAPSAVGAYLQAKHRTISRCLFRKSGFYADSYVDGLAFHFENSPEDAQWLLYKITSKLERGSQFLERIVHRLLTRKIPKQ